MAKKTVKRRGAAPGQGQGFVQVEALGSKIDWEQVKRRDDESRRIKAVELALQMGVQHNDGDADITLLERAKAIEEYLRDGKVPEFELEDEETTAAG